MKEQRASDISLALFVVSSVLCEARFLVQRRVFVLGFFQDGNV
jgi:hypothetical protein